MNRYSGISALAPVVQQTEDFVQKKNIPPSQVVPFLLSLGRPELAGAVANRMSLEAATERMKAMQQGNAAPPTVAQENAAKLQNAEAQLAQGMGAMPAGVMDRAQFQGGITGEPMEQPVQRMAGGGPIAFQVGGEMPAAVATEADIFGNPAIRRAVAADLGVAEEAIEQVPKSVLKDWAAKNAPTISKWFSSAGEAGLGGIARGAARTVGKGAAYVGVPYEVGRSSLRTLQADPAYVAEEYGLDPNVMGTKSLAGALSYGENLLNIPTLGLYGMLRGETPQDRALERTRKDVSAIEGRTAYEQKDLAKYLIERKGADKVNALVKYQQAVKQFGADSPQAADAEKAYKEAAGSVGAGVDSQALADYIARSAKGDKEEGKPTLGAMPAYADPFAKSRTELDKQLKDMEDVSTPEARDKLFKKEFQDKMDFYKEQGITKPLMDAQDRINLRRDQIGLQKDKDFGKALALMGFTMMKTKGSFLTALGEGGSASLAAMETFEEKRQAALDKLDDRELAINQQISAYKEKAGTAAEARVDKLEAKRDELKRQQFALQQAGDTLRATQSFQWAMQERTFQANIDAIDRRYGGNLERQIEKDIIARRNVLNSNAPANIKAQAKRELEQLMAEREKATQGGSASYQAMLLKNLATQSLLGGAAPSAAGASADEDLVNKWLK